MKTRLFFFAVNFDSAKAIIEDLIALDYGEEDLHVIARDDVALESLPEPDITHRSDIIDAVKRGAATGGAIGLLGSMVAVTVPPIGLTLGGAAILGGTALGTAGGTWFSTLVGVSVRNQDVEDYRYRIDRGELMTIVDSERDQELRLKSMLESRYPNTLLLAGNLDAA